MISELSHFQRWVDQHNHVDLSTFVPFVIEGTVYGAVHRTFFPQIQAYPDVFVISDRGVTVHPALDTPEKRTDAVAIATAAWHDAGLFPRWRDERYRVSNTFNAPSVMNVERATASTFGIISYGVHINGLVWKQNKLHIWVARRAADKPEYPGMLDHLTAGGIPAGYTVAQVVHKECYEEAGIPSEIAQTARAVSSITYAVSGRKSIARSCNFVYDLVLPEDFTPHNTDGEVQSFDLLPVDEVIALVRDTESFKRNCNLVLIDLFARYGLFTPDMPGYTALLAGLRSPQTLF